MSSKRKTIVKPKFDLLRNTHLGEFGIDESSILSGMVVVDKALDQFSVRLALESQRRGDEGYVFLSSRVAINPFASLLLHQS